MPVLVLAGDPSGNIVHTVAPISPSILLQRETCECQSGDITFFLTNALQWPGTQRSASCSPAGQTALPT